MRGDGEIPQSSGVGGFLRRRWFAILLPLVLVQAAALAFSLLQDKEYRAETTLLFRDTGPVLASVEPEREAATNVRLLQLPALTDRVEARRGGDLNAEVDVVAEAESNLATVTVVASSAKEAAQIANVYAQEFIDLREEDYRQGLKSETKAVEERLAGLSKAELAGREGQALQTQLQDLELAAADSSSPGAPNRPRRAPGRGVLAEAGPKHPDRGDRRPRPRPRPGDRARAPRPPGPRPAVHGVRARRPDHRPDPAQPGAGPRGARHPCPARARGRRVPDGPGQPPPPARAPGHPLFDRHLGDPGRGEDDPGLEPGPDRGRRRVAGAAGRGRPAPPEPRQEPRGQRRRRPLRAARLRPGPAPGPDPTGRLRGRRRARTASARAARSTSCSPGRRLRTRPSCSTPSGCRRCSR